jgi:NAD(P)-dependent dehydrogenase (short-subunit alcohol dehydrogenase family)
MSKKPVCVVAGVGPGNGLATARKFAEGGYRVALLARSEGPLREFESDVPESRAYPTDLTSESEVVTTFERIHEELGPVHVLVQNAAGFAHGGLLETTPAQLEASWRCGPWALLLTARAVVPSMLQTGGGSIIVVGATASMRTNGQFLAFAAAKSALRSVSESMAKDLGPQGIHVAHVIVDGIIDRPRTEPAGALPVFLKPESIAVNIWNLVQQDPSAWTFELDLRPCREKW